MTFSEARALAKAGAAVRRDAWPSTRTLIYSAGTGTVRAVACLVNGSVITVVKNTDFGQTEFEAQDWRQA